MLIPTVLWNTTLCPLPWLSIWVARLRQMARWRIASMVWASKKSWGRAGGEKTDWSYRPGVLKREINMDWSCTDTYAMTAAVCTWVSSVCWCPLWKETLPSPWFGLRVWRNSGCWSGSARGALAPPGRRRWHCNRLPHTSQRETLVRAITVNKNKSHELLATLGCNYSFHCLATMTKFAHKQNMQLYARLLLHNSMNSS